LSEEASELNVRVLVAHVGVSMLGKMFKITRLPRKSLFEISCSVPVVSVNAGAVAPFIGNLPLVETGLPPSVTVDPLLLEAFFTAFLTTFFTDFFAAFLAVFLTAFFTTFLTDFFLAIFFFADFFFAAMAALLICEVNVPRI
jgi:hypothetical protein